MRRCFINAELGPLARKEPSSRRRLDRPTKEAIDEVVAIVETGALTPYAAAVSLAEIEANDFNLSVDRYVLTAADRRRDSAWRAQTPLNWGTSPSSSAPRPSCRHKGLVLILPRGRPR